MDSSVDDRSQPILSASSFHGNFNRELDPSHIDVDENDDSCCATVTRGMTNFVSKIFRPRQIIVVLRLLKAMTFCCLCLTIAADLLFVFFVEFTVSDDISMRLGGWRDRVIRLYGVVLAILAVLVELDMKVISQSVPGLKGFLPRSMLLLFVAALSTVSPMIRYERLQQKQNQKNGYYNNYYNDDDGSSLIADEVPGSAVMFQWVTSFFLFASACIYFILGLLCFDRFTSQAFLSEEDPVSATAIQIPREESYDSYESDRERRMRHYRTRDRDPDGSLA